jgi:copper chaperone CopZ
MTSATGTARTDGTPLTDGTALTEGTATATFGITGMSCGHCVAAVTEGLEAVPGVTGVAIDLAAKQATVTSEGPLDAATVRDAVEGAGYQLA